MSCPFYIKFTLTAVVMFTCLIRFHAYLLAGAERKGNTEDVVGYGDGGEYEADERRGEEGEEYGSNEESEEQWGK